jgi:hypothetical protein
VTWPRGRKEVDLVGRLGILTNVLKSRHMENMMFKSCFMSPSLPFEQFERSWHVKSTSWKETDELGEPLHQNNPVSSARR